MIRLYQYSSSDLTFLLVDGRNVEVSRFRKPRVVHDLCLMHGFDALLILDLPSEKADFSLEVRDSSGREVPVSDSAAACAVAFADLLGVKPFHSTDYTFENSGTVHSAGILSHLGENKLICLAAGDSQVTVDALCQGEFF